MSARSPQTLMRGDGVDVCARSERTGSPACDSDRGEPAHMQIPPLRYGMKRWQVNGWG